MTAQSKAAPRREVLFSEFLLRLQPPAGGMDILSWVRTNLDDIEQSLLQHGAILLQGFDLSTDQFAELTRIVAPQARMMEYTFGLAPRAKHSEGLYLSTLAPKEAFIQQHHEMAYLPDWPMKLFFYCDIPARVGGETPLACTRRFMKRLDPKIWQRLEEKKIRYIRNYEPGLGEGSFSGWERSFASADKSLVEAYCKANNISFSWGPGDFLRTSTIGNAVAKHPRTGEVLWNNHAFNLYLYSAGPEGPAPFVRNSGPGWSKELLQRIMSAREDELPFHVTYGDGSPIERSIVETVATILDEEAREFPWHKGDCVIVDNLLAFHGRKPFEGERRTLAVLKEPYSDCVKAAAAPAT